MRVLIMTCNTGEGHNSCAKAIKQGFEEKGAVCDVIDSLQFISDRFSRFFSWGHITIYRRLPGLFRHGYGYVEKHPGILDEGSVMYKVFASGMKRFYALMQQEKYDVVLCTHVFAGLLLNATLREHPMNIKTGFIATDYTCYPGAASTGLQRFFIPAAELTEAFVSSGVPREKLHISGIPIRQEFYSRTDRAAAKAHFGLKPDRPHLVLMCGSMGCGPMEELAKQLSKRMCKRHALTIVCGTNEKLYRTLKEKYGYLSNVHIKGFVKEMSLLMDSADLYLTKPGGLSVTEAAAKHLPMVYIDAVAGCEGHNCRFFVQNGGAVTAATVPELTALCLSLLRDPARREAMSAQLAALGIKNATCDIWEQLQPDVRQPEPVC